MAKVQQLSLICRDPEEMQDYYTRWFSFGTIERTPKGSVYLTDGYLNIALIKPTAGSPEENRYGIHHIGIQVEDTAKCIELIRTHYPDVTIKRTDDPDDPYSEYQIHDNEPWGVRIDLSQKGYGTPGEKRVPGVRHIAYGDSDVERRIRFFSTIFAFKEVEVQADPANEGKKRRGCVADGNVNVCLVSRNDESARHFGVLIKDPSKVVAEMTEAYPSRPDIWELTRPGVESHIRDVEGNNVSLSANRGWEVSPGRWDRLGE